MGNRSNVLLTGDELINLSGYRRPARQAQWLTENGIYYKRRGDGSLVILRKHLEEQMGCGSQTLDRPTPEPDFSSLQ